MLVELSELLCRDHGASFAPSTLWCFLERHAIRFLKIRTPASRSAPTSQPSAEHGSKLSLTMIPSAWFSSTRPAPSTKLARFRRRAGCGQCCQASVPHGHWKTTTFTGALRLSGMTAPLVLDEPINRAAFQAYIQQVLGPARRSGDTMILDNLPAHKGANVRRAIESAGVTPPYSLDFNPIENAFSKLKASLRKAAEVLSTAFGMRAGMRSRQSRNPSAQTTSPPQGMSRNERNLL